MSKIYHYIILFQLLIFAVSCNNRNTKEKKVEASTNVLINREIYFPDSMLLYSEDTVFIIDSSFFSDNKPKLIHSVNLNCGNCLYNLQEWEQLLPEFKACKIVFWLNDFEGNDSLIDSLCNRFPAVNFISDYHGCFECINDLVYPDMNLSSLLLDGSNKIRLTGDPVYNKKLGSLYIQTLNKIKNNNL